MSIAKKTLIENLKNDLSEPNLQIFKNSVDVKDLGESILLSINDAYMKQWIENKCLTIIKSYINQSIQIEIEESEEVSDTNQLELFNVTSSPKLDSIHYYI